jgi:predicted lipoprotein with Yx(FWY)xxD motif
MRRSGIGLLGLVALAIALAGCGGSSKPSSEAESGKGKGGGIYGSSSPTTTTTTSAAAGGAAMVTVKSNPTLGSILAAGPKKLTVYMFKADHGGKSSCYGACESAWPPVITTGTPKGAGGVVAAKLGTTTRSNGTKQVTYAGLPLYYYTPDSTEADITGQGVTSFGAPWYVMAPSGEVVTKA